MLDDESDILTYKGKKMMNQRLKKRRMRNKKIGM